MVVPSPQWVHDLTEERGWKFLDQIRAEIATRSRSNASDVEKDHESHGNVHAVPATTLILSPDQQEDSQLWLAMHSLLHTAGHLSFSLRGALLLWLSSAFDLSYKGIQVRGTTEAITAWCQYATPQVSDPDMSIYYRLIDCTRGLPEMSVSHLHATTKILLKRTQRRTIHPPHHSCFKTPALPLPVAQCGLQIHATPWMELLSATYLCLLEAQRSQNLQSDSEKNDPRAVQQMRESIETVNTLLNAFGKQLLGYNCNVGSGYSFVVKQDDAWVQVSDETAKRRQRAYFCTNSEHVLCASPTCGTTVGASSSRIQSIGYPELSESTKRFGSRESVLCAVQKEMVKDKRTYIQTVIDEIHFVQDNQFIDPLLGDPIDLDIQLSTRLPYRRFQLMRALLTAPSPTVLNAVAQNGRLFQPPTPQTSSKHELQELEQFLLNLENETKENVQ